MAPEVLLYNPDRSDNIFIEQDFKSFIQCDVYSLGLVMWEIVSRTATEGKIYKNTISIALACTLSF